jgi:hypothetical protein
MSIPVPLPIHFKLPGRSYSQIGRKGNVALYSVYSDYLIIPSYALPYALIGFELIVIKVKDGSERYPSAWQFGSCAWSVPKSFLRTCSARSRSCLNGWRKRCRSTSKTVPNRSTSSEVSADVAQRSETNDQTPKMSPLRGFISLTAPRDATNTPQRRVTLLKGQL